MPDERHDQTGKLLPVSRCPVCTYEMDAATFDTKWREWVLKTYPKK